MNLRQSLRRAAGAPARRFFDERFHSVEHRVDEVGQRAGEDVARAREDLVHEFENRLDRISFELAAATRAHLEAMSYVAVELARIEAGLVGEIDALRADVLAAGGERGRALAIHAFALKALASVPSDGRIFVRGSDTELTARALSMLGHQVTASADCDDPQSAGARIAESNTAYSALVLSVAPAQASGGDPEVARAVELLAPGGLAVLMLDDDAPTPSGLEIIDRTTAGDTGDGSWRIGNGAEAGVTLLAARRS